MRGIDETQEPGEYATSQQPVPTSTGADITDLAKSDVQSLQFLSPEHGMATVYLWIRSAAAFIHTQVNTGELPLAPGVSGFLPGYLSKGLISDLEARAQMGMAKYGTRLKAHNGRSALVDLYQELMDAFVYMRQHIEEQHVQK
jgi:hypothetical protein